MDLSFGRYCHTDFEAAETFKIRIKPVSLRGRRDHASVARAGDPEKHRDHAVLVLSFFFFDFPF